MGTRVSQSVKSNQSGDGRGWLTDSGAEKVVQQREHLDLGRPVVNRRCSSYMTREGTGGVNRNLVGVNDGRPRGRVERGRAPPP